MARIPAGDPPVSDALLRALAANPEIMADLIQTLHRRVQDPGTLIDLMDRVAREAVRLISGVEWAGVTAQFSGGPFTTARTDDRVLLVDERQYEFHDGPCLRAMHSGLQIHMDATEVRSTWPELAADAGRVGIHSFLALPIRADSSCIGSLNLYGPDDAIIAPDQDVLAVLVGYLDRGFGDFRRSRQGPAGESALRVALANWGQIEQAVGVMMDRYGFSADYARDTLIDHAREAGRTLEEEAFHVIEQSVPPVS